MKRSLALILSLAMLICIFPAGLTVSAAADRDGYTLEPTQGGVNGVDVLSEFILTTPADVTLEAAASALSVDGGHSISITQNSSTEYLVTPAEPLAHNKLYTFRLSREDEADITWAFQTSVAFEITGNLPGNQATGVPINTGIEIYFSTPDYQELDSLFSISPTVKGRFEYHGNTAVFVPLEKLSHQTIYTVTIAAGIEQKEGSGVIADDYIFSFETQAKSEVTVPDSHMEIMYFTESYTQRSSVEAPMLSLVAHDSRKGDPLNPEIYIFRFPSEKKALEAVWDREDTPYWSRYARDKSYVDVLELKHVVSFKADQSFDGRRNVLTLPDSLPEGFYLIEAKTGSSSDQMILQISDLAIQVVADEDKSVVWVNDIATGRGANNATVYDKSREKAYRTDENGICEIDRSLENKKGFEWLSVTASNGRKGAWFYRRKDTRTSPDEDYWKYLRLDRSLFQPDDTLYFWGFVQNRWEDEEISDVKAVLEKGYGGYMSDPVAYDDYGDVMQTISVPVDENSYSGAIKLPELDKGSYYLAIYHGDIQLGSTYFTVDQYEKPSYTLTVKPEKAAIFIDEEAVFNIKSSFFEGTPVANLDLSYRLSGHQIVPQEDTVTTDNKGMASLSLPIDVQQGAQDWLGAVLLTEATLPEMGSTLDYSYLSVFVNDIDVAPKASREGENASLSVSVNSINLDRINNGTAKYYNDYLDKPIEDKVLDVSIYRSYWVKEESGVDYDFIEKKTRPQYRYERQEEVIDRFELTTDSDGNAYKEFTVPDREYESYFAKVKCLDGNGRSMEYDVYIGRDYSYYFYAANSNTYHLETEKYDYDLDEEVLLTMKFGDRVLKKGNFLFLRARDGITEYQAGENPYSFTFSEDDVPNTHILAYYFDGRQYQGMGKSIYYDYENRRLSISVVPDKESYQPGDMCTLSITAKDKDGAGKEAEINLSVVDEALLALRNYSVYPLQDLYRYVGSGVAFSSSTHNRNYIYDDTDDDELNDAEAPMAPEKEPAAGGGEEAYLREEFKDTAIFQTVYTDEKGMAKCTFKLPDNLTSWRVIAVGISDDLYAGDETANIIVSIEAFLNYTLSGKFLTGDIPTVGVNAYGSSLSGDETVLFEVWDELNPDEIYSAETLAFERVNIPIWEMTQPGSRALIIRATVNGSVVDMLKHEYEVIESYREAETSQYYDLSLDTEFDAGSSGITTITFTDKSRGQYLYQLLCLRWGSSDRLENRVVSRGADRLLDEYFPELDKWGYNDFNPREYQKGNGGMGILPYADSDLLTTVKLMPYLLPDIDLLSLKKYLYNVYNGENSDNKICALYGLAMLKEPVLLDLDAYAELEEIPAADAVYLAMGYYSLGEIEKANAIYDTRIAPKLQHAEPYYWVDSGADDFDIVEASSAAGLIAAWLDKPEQEGLYAYCLANRSDDPLIKIEKLGYLTTAIPRAPKGSGSVSYTVFGESHTKELKNGGSFCLRIPSVNIGEIKITGVSGEVAAVSTYMAPLSEISVVDSDISVSRTYYNQVGEEQLTFGQGELVKVEIKVDYTGSAVKGFYSISDYLPSGLAFVSNSAKGPARASCYARSSGQQVRFYDYSNEDRDNSVYYYYARVVSPGEYRAEGTLVQNISARDYMSVGLDDVIVIE